MEAGEEAGSSGVRRIQVPLTSTRLPQSLEKMDIEQKMSIRILK